MVQSHSTNYLNSLDFLPHYLHVILIMKLFIRFVQLFTKYWYHQNLLYLLVPNPHRPALYSSMSYHQRACRVRYCESLVYDGEEALHLRVSHARTYIVVKPEMHFATWRLSISYWLRSFCSVKCERYPTHFSRVQLWSWSIGCGIFPRSFSVIGSDTFSRLLAAIVGIASQTFRVQRTAIILTHDYRARWTTQTT